METKTEKSRPGSGPTRRRAAGRMLAVGEEGAFRITGVFPGVPCAPPPDLPLSNLSARGSAQELTFSHRNPPTASSRSRAPVLGAGSDSFFRRKLCPNQMQRRCRIPQHPARSPSCRLFLPLPRLLQRGRGSHHLRRPVQSSGLEPRWLLAPRMVQLRPSGTVSATYTQGFEEKSS